MTSGADKTARGIAFALFFTALVQAVEVRAQSAPLAGLKTARVEVVINGTGLERHPELARALENPDILPEVIKTRLELEIRRSSGLQIVPAAQSTLRAVVVVAVTRVENPTSRVLAYSYTAGINLEEPVLVPRNKIVVRAPIWQSYVIYASSQPNLSEIVPDLDRALAQFLNDYLAANPRVP
jgi:hypothetical protein